MTGIGYIVTQMVLYRSTSRVCYESHALIINPSTSKTILCVEVQIISIFFNKATTSEPLNLDYSNPNTGEVNIV